MTVNLVGRSKQKKGLAPTLACGFKDIQRTTDVDLKVFARIINRSRDRNLRRKVVHLGSGCTARCTSVASRTSPTVIFSRSESPATRRNQLTLCCTPRRDKLSKM